MFVLDIRDSEKPSVTCFFFLLSLALTELKFFLNNVDFLQQSWLLCSCHLVQRRKSRMIAFGEAVLDYHDSGFELCG